MSISPTGETPKAVLLLVDDHADTRAVLGRMLARRGHEVIEAGSMADALAKYRERTIDLVISDLGLPDGSGHDLLARLRAVRPVRGIALSGYGMEADIRRSREVGFDEHLTKPIDFETLVAAIQAVQEKSVAERS
jgi:CheY-like chemotaxis protein